MGNFFIILLFFVFYGGDGSVDQASGCVASYCVAYPRNYGIGDDAAIVA